MRSRARPARPTSSPGNETTRPRERNSHQQVVVPQRELQPDQVLRVEHQRNPRALPIPPQAVRPQQAHLEQARVNAQAHVNERYQRAHQEDDLGRRVLLVVRVEGAQGPRERAQVDRHRERHLREEDEGGEGGGDQGDGAVEREAEEADPEALQGVARPAAAPGSDGRGEQVRVVPAAEPPRRPPVVEGAPSVVAAVVHQRREQSAVLHQVVPPQLRGRDPLLRLLQLPAEGHQILDVHGVDLAPLLVVVVVVAVRGAVRPTRRDAVRAPPHPPLGAQVGRLVLPSHQNFQAVVELRDLVRPAAAAHTPGPPATRPPAAPRRPPPAHPHDVPVLLVLQRVVVVLPQAHGRPADLLDLVLHVLEPHDRLEQLLLEDGGHDPRPPQLVRGTGLPPQPLGDVHESVPQQEGHEEQSVRVPQRHEDGEDDRREVEAPEVDGHRHDADDAGPRHEGDGAEGPAARVPQPLAQREMAGVERLAGYGEDEPREEERRPVRHLPREVGGVVGAGIVVVLVGDVPVARVDLLAAAVVIAVVAVSPPAGAVVRVVERVHAARVAQVDGQERHGGGAQSERDDGEQDHEEGGPPLGVVDDEPRRRHEEEGGQGEERLVPHACDGVRSRNRAGSTLLCLIWRTMSFVRAGWWLAYGGGGGARRSTPARRSDDARLGSRGDGGGAVGSGSFRVVSSFFVGRAERDFFARRIWRGRGYLLASRRARRRSRRRTGEKGNGATAAPATTEG